MQNLRRRDFVVGVGSVLSVTPLAAAPANRSASQPKVAGRKLGSLEVSCIGLGVQNMSRKFDTTVPYRPEMIELIREAYDNGVTFFDTAVAFVLGLSGVEAPTK